MTAADSRDDVGGYKAAWQNRVQSLRRARALLRGALRFAPKTSKYHQDLRSRIASVNALLDDMTGDKAGSPLEAKTLDETTFTQGEQTRLEEIEAAISVAALTQGTQDDLGAQQIKEQFLAPLLAAAQASGGAGRGGPSAISEIATELKGARDTIAELTRAPELTADQQATAEQSYQRGLAEGRGASIDRLVNATLGGAGAAGLTVNFNSLTASPNEARKAADVIVGGLSFQGGRPSSTERLGV